MEMVAAAEAGAHALLVAPTGGGKTLAGFLPSLIDLAERGPRPDFGPGSGVHTLYLSPLKALTTDVERNLMTPIREIGLNIPAGDDFASWCMAAMAFLGLAHTFKSGDMIRVGLLIDRFKGRTRWFFEVFSLVLGLGFVGFFAWHAVVMTWQSYEFNDVAGGVVAMPMWIPQLGYSGGLVILFIAFVDEFVHVVLRGQEPRYEKPPAQSDEEIVERAMASGV